LWVTALEVAIRAPLEQKAYAAKIPWSVINELRAIFDEMGIDWREAKKIEDAKRKKLSQEYDEKRYTDNLARQAQEAET
jgi:rRNA-processing protein FCF1